MDKWILSFDVGKKSDPSGVGLYKCWPRLDGDGVVWYLLLAQQWKWRRMPYTEQAANIATLTGRMRGDLTFVMDATGVGEAVKDLLVAKGLNPLCIYYSGGATAHKVRSGNGSTIGWTVPKQDLVHAAQLLVQQHRIKVLPSCRRRDEFAAQMKGFKGRINERGRLSADAVDDELHDDMVNHALMASWYFVMMDRQLDEVARSVTSLGREPDTYPDWDPWEV